MLDARALIEKYKGKGVLIDTNLLVLFLVGAVSRRRIQSFKRTGDFVVEDFDLLVRLMRWFGKLFSTPHVLSQVSDLTDLPGTELALVRQRFTSLIEEMDERFEPSRSVIRDPAFARFGLTDAAITLVSSEEILVLTADVALHYALQQRGLDALNFNHIRALCW